jgi:hypothetical protein
MADLDAMVEEVSALANKGAVLYVNGKSQAGNARELASSLGELNAPATDALGELLTLGAACIDMLDRAE